MLISRSVLTWKRPINRSAVLCLLLSIFLACSGGADPIEWKKIIPPPKNGGPPAVQSSDHLVVYLDTSMSMAGYLSPDGKVAFGNSSDGQTVFSRTLQALRNVVTTLNPSVSVVFRRVDSAVGQPSFNDLNLGQASVNRGTYSGKETNLAGAISLFPEAVQSEQGRSTGRKDSQSQENAPLPPARFHILITDGVQSTKGQRTETSCTSGSDYVCVKKALFALMKSGWAGCVLGIRSEFKGPIYSEIKSGLTLPYETKKQDPESLRPFYLYIFSPDRDALDKVVEKIKEEIRPLLSRQDAIREYALASAYADGFARGEIIVPKESADFLERSKSKEESPARLTLRVDLDTEKSGAKPFAVAINIPWSSHARDSGTVQELWDMVRWELVPINPEGASLPDSGHRVRYPEVKLTGQQADADGHTIVQATAVWPQGAGSPAWKAYRLEARLNLEKQAPPWVKQWSTDTDTTKDVGNRTLNLVSALGGLWNNPSMENQVVAEVYLRVGPP